MDASNSSARRLSRLQAGAAIAWIAGTVGLGIVSRTTPDLHVCTTTTVATNPATSTETTHVDAERPETKTTETAASTSTTRACAPPAVGELAVLMLPALALIWPALKGFNIAGLFGVDLREFKEEVIKESDERMIRLIVELRRGEATAAAVDDMPLVDLPDDG